MTAAVVDIGHPDIEAWLEQRHVAFEYHPELPVDQVDATASLANQARLEALNEEVVDRYAADMERGDRFPPIIANRVRHRRGDRLVLIGGNHRLAAAQRAGIATLAAYVVDAEPDMVVRLTFEDNRRHGLPPSEEERIFQAVHLVNTGYTQTAAAEVCGLHPQKLNRAIAISGADQRAAGMGVKGWNAMPKTTRWRLGAIGSDPVFRAAAQLAVDTSMKADDIERLVVRLKAARSEADAMALIGDETEARTHDAQSTAGGAIRKNTARTKLLSSIGYLRVADPAEVSAACASPVQKADLAKRIDDSIKRLQAIKKALA